MPKGITLPLLRMQVRGNYRGRRVHLHTRDGGELYQRISGGGFTHANTTPMGRGEGLAYQ